MTDITIDNYFVKQDCPVCNSSEGKVLYTKILHTCNVLKKSGINLRNEDVLPDIVECKNCGHIYLSMTLKDEVLKYYYNVVETEYYDGKRLSPVDHRPAETKAFAEFIAKNSKSDGKVLEIGSGLGFLLKELEILGLDCFGIEPSGFASNFAKNELKLNVINGMLSQETYGEIKFDLIVLSDVIEHISKPNELLKLIKFYLADNGKIILLTGNSRSLYAKICEKKWLYFYSWEHMSYFNKKSIHFLLNNNSLNCSYYKNIKHSGTFYSNMSSFLKTIVMKIFDKLKIRKYTYFLMAFDHLIAIGENKVEK